MEIEFDPDKEATNLAKHKISLRRAADLQVLGLEFVERRGERRLKIMGLIDGEFHVLIAVFRTNAVRAISLRRGDLEELDKNG